MKRLFLGAALMLASLAASAQLYVGGSIGLQRNISDNVTDIKVSPEIGYNYSDEWAFGTEIGYQHTYNDGLKVNIFAIAPYARYNYFRYEKVKLFVDGGFGLGFGKAKVDDHSSDTATLFEIGLKPGVAFDVTDKFGLVAHFGFLGYRGGNDAGKDIRPETIGFDFSTLDLSLGFYVNF
ncbi:MAG: porin family protein [Clostridiales bacterium]|nr:porin family protein [Clostridiales bacterium]